MAQFIRINGALIQVSDSTSVATLEQHSEVKTADLVRVSDYVTIDKVDAALTATPGASSGQFLFHNACPERELHCVSIAVASGGVALTSGTIMIHGEGNGVWQERELAVFDLSANPVTAGQSASLLVEPATVLGSGELISFYADPALDAAVFTGSITLDLRRREGQL